MDNGRYRIRKMCDLLNQEGIVPFKINVDGIETATGKELAEIVNKFIDDLESIPSAIEKLVTHPVKVLYNALCEGTVSFEPAIEHKTSECISVTICSEPYERTDIETRTDTEVEEKDTSS